MFKAADLNLKAEDEQRNPKPLSALNPIRPTSPGNPVNPERPINPESPINPVSHISPKIPTNSQETHLTVECEPSTLIGSKVKTCVALLRNRGVGMIADAIPSSALSYVYKNIRIS